MRRGPEQLRRFGGATDGTACLRMQVGRVPIPSTTQTTETNLDYLTCSEMCGSGQARFIRPIRTMRKTAARIKSRAAPALCVEDRGVSDRSMFAPLPASGSSHNSREKTLAFDAYAQAPESFRLTYLSVILDVHFSSLFIKVWMRRRGLEVGTQWVLSPEPAFSSYRSTIP